MSAVDISAALAEIKEWVTTGQRKYVCVTGVHGVMESQRDPSLLHIHNAAGMVLPDGMPLVWAGRFAGAREIGHVRGADLMSNLCGLAAREGWSSYLYGGAPGVTGSLAAKLVERFPNLKLAGMECPPYRELTTDEYDDVAARINASGAHLIWVGLGTPKQERWMARMRDRLDAQVLLGVGGAFDMHAGRTRQAARWLQPLGLEWLHRLALEPRRLWRRYLRNNPMFLTAVLRQPPRLSTPESSSHDTGVGA